MPFSTFELFPAIFIFAVMLWPPLSTLLLAGFLHKKAGQRVLPRYAVILWLFGLSSALCCGTLAGFWKAGPQIWVEAAGLVGTAFFFYFFVACLILSHLVCLATFHAASRRLRKTLAPQ